MAAAERWTNPARRKSRRRLVGGVRARILGWYLLLLAIATVTSVLVLRQVLHERLDDEVNDSLAQEVAEVRALAGGRDPATGRPFDANVRAIFDTFLARNIPPEGEALFTFLGGRPYRTSVGAPYRLDRDPELARRWGALEQGSERGEISTPAGRARFIAVPIGPDDAVAGVFVVANFLRQERAEVDEAIRTSTAVSLSVLVGASLLAWIIAGRILAPVREVTETARAITETDLTRRIPVKGHDEIAELTATFNAMLERLEAAFAAHRAFVDDASHELRTPITIIRGHIELMGEDPAEQRETVALVIDELSRMSRLVDDLLLLAQSERPGFLQLEPVDIASLTKQALVKATALGRRSWGLDAVAVGTFTADRARLTQALMNLAQNATQHTSVGDTITIGSSAADGELRFWVEDGGAGIEAGEVEHIFERFGRARNVRRRSDGHGLGLAIVKAIAEAHGGHIDLQSRPGTGSRFTLVLPMHSRRRPEPWRAS